MLCLKTNNINFVADKYIEISDFDNLYEIFKNFIDMLDSNHKEEYHLYNDKFLLATVVGCIEGNIQIDMKNNLWYIWFGQYEASGKLDNNQEQPYLFHNIYDVIKNNVEFYDFIIKYYNLWHESNNPEFTYDKYHIQDIQKNFHQLIYIINLDIKNEKNIMSNYIIEPYKTLYATLIGLFSNPKLRYT